MNEPSATSSPFVAFYSPWKAVGLTVILAVLGICPLLPGFSKGLVYTAFFYTKFGYPFLIAACLVIFYMTLAMLPIIVRAILNKPAIEITADTIRIWGLKWREYPLSCAANGGRKQFGSLYLRGLNGKQFVIPLWIYQNPFEVQQRLMAPGLALASMRASGKKL